MKFEKFLQSKGLRSNPFSLSLPPQSFVNAQPSVFESLKQEIKEGKVAVLTGEFGVGKSTFCRQLISELERESLPPHGQIGQIRHVSVFIRASAYESVTEVLRSIVLELGLDAKRDRAHLFHELNSWPENHQENLIVVVDDASEFGGDIVEFGEFIRAVSDINRISLLLDGVWEARGKRRGIKHFLAATPALESRASLAELKHMSERAMEQMLKERILRVSSTDKKRWTLISRKAVSRIHKISKGIPREALKAADKALKEAARRGCSISDEIVCEANNLGFWRRVLGG